MSSQLSDLLHPNRILVHQIAHSKKCVFESFSNVIDDATNITSDDLLSAFIARERLGSTAIGHGVAIPHIRTDAIERPVGAFMSLNQGIDYDSTDKQKVDLIFALVVPDNNQSEHLRVMSGLAERFNAPEFRDKCRKAADNRAIQTIFS